MPAMQEKPSARCPASESRQRTNPRAMVRGGAARPASLVLKFFSSPSAVAAASFNPASMRSHSRPYSGPVLATRPHRTLKIPMRAWTRMRRCFHLGPLMDAKTCNLLLLVGLSLLSAGVAAISDHVVLGWVFFALGAVAALGIVERHWR